MLDLVGLPNHPQLRNYMTQHYDSFNTIVTSGEWLIEQTLTLCCFNVGPTSSPVAPMKYKHVVPSPFFIPSKQYWAVVNVFSYQYHNIIRQTQLCFVL